jgi:hypothetical protein
MADTTLTQSISADTVKPHAPANMTAGEPRTCCGGPSPTDPDACCARDADVKAVGGAGCGCGSVAAAPAKKSGCCG